MRIWGYTPTWREPSHERMPSSARSSSSALSHDAWKNSDNHACWRTMVFPICPCIEVVASVLAFYMFYMRSGRLIVSEPCWRRLIEDCSQNSLGCWLLDGLAGRDYRIRTDIYQQSKHPGSHIANMRLLMMILMVVVMERLSSGLSSLAKLPRMHVHQTT